MPLFDSAYDAIIAALVKVEDRLNQGPPSNEAAALRAARAKLQLALTHVALQALAEAAREVDAAAAGLAKVTASASTDPVVLAMRNAREAFGGHSIGDVQTSTDSGDDNGGDVGEEGEEAPLPDTSGSPPVSVPPVVTAPSPSTSGVSHSGLTLTEAHLIALWKRSLFPIDGRGLIIFGIRGCLPIDYSGTPFATEHGIALRTINYTTMNCTIGQWHPSKGFALFPGSTVPYSTYVEAGVPNRGIGVNQLGRGRYTNYIPGWHKRMEGSSGHWALLQECPITLQRTGNDADYDLQDRWEVGRIAGDNIHCAFHMGPGAAIPNSKFSSVGCQVVAGTVKKGMRGSERGPWAKFIAPFLPGATTQSGAEYVLFDGAEVQQMISTKCAGKTVILRMGSKGDLVGELQRGLSKRLGREIDDDGDFGPTTFQAVIDFQTGIFGENSDDGIVGPETAAELGFELPLFQFDDAISGGPGLSWSSLEGPTSDGLNEGSPKIAWGAIAEQKCGPEFKQKVITIANRLGCDPSNLMAVMAFETGGTFAPDKRNVAESGATGLIQFMPKTAEALGTTTDDLARMSATDQLVYVEKYFRSVAGSRKLPTLSDLYMAVLYPVAVGRHESFILFKAPSKAYTQNSGLDVNGDGLVTKAEATEKVARRLVKGMEASNLG
jgi:hypothetical protein